MSRRYRDLQRWSLLLAGLLMVVLVLYPVYGEEAEMILSSQEIESLIPSIEDVEKSIHSLKVDAESWVEERSSLSDPWKKTPVCCFCTAWFDGNPKGRVKVDVHKQVGKWMDGAAPYAEESYSIAFDGNCTKSITHTTGPLGKQVPAKEAQVVSGAQEWLRSGYMGACTGCRFTTNFFFNGKEVDTSFSRLFRLAISPEAAGINAFEFAYEQKDGVLCLKFGLRPAKWGRETWWIDPSRGFSLIAYLHTSKVNGAEHVISDIKVNKLQEVAKGVWWPMEATVESEPRDPNSTYKRTVYKALKVVANDPSFDESIFTPAFPKGYRVDDKVAGKTYVVDVNGK